MLHQFIAKCFIRKLILLLMSQARHYDNLPINPRKQQDSEKQNRKRTQDSK